MLKLVSLNIEKDKHLATVTDLLQRESPDVFCCMELLEGTVPHFEALGYRNAFLPMAWREVDGRKITMGVGTFVRNTLPVTFRSWYYHAVPEHLPHFNRDDQESTIQHGILFADIVYDNKSFLIGATHFTWAPHGEQASNTQHEHMRALLAGVSKERPHVLCGDFNIPRRYNELYNDLTTTYTDAVPSEYASSLDKTIHRLGSDDAAHHLFTSFMVDYVFTQQPYQTHDVRLEFGVSDHAAVVAHISQ